MFSTTLLILVVIFNGCSTSHPSSNPAKAFTPGEVSAMELSLRRGLGLEAQGRHREAEVEIRRILKLTAQKLGPEAPQTLLIRTDLAVGMMVQGRYSEAEAELRHIIGIQQRVLGPTHPDTLASRSKLCWPLVCQHKLAEAEAQYRAILAIQEKTPGPPSAETLENRANLACVLAIQGKEMLAEVYLRNVLGDMEQLLGSEHPLTLTTLGSLTQCLGKRNKLQEARQLAPRLVESSRKVFGPSSFKAKYYESLEVELNRGRQLPLAGPEVEKGR